MRHLQITSCMAQNADFICADLADYISEQLQLPTAFIGDISWQERERRFDAGDIQVCWICGLPYAWKADRGQPPLELLVAPVMQGVRYQGQPVYFSDVLVLCTSRFQTFADLRGTTWAYNEPGSHSGYTELCSPGEAVRPILKEARARLCPIHPTSSTEFTGTIDSG